MSRAIYRLSLLLGVVTGSICPTRYTQAANGGDCFMVKSFYDTFATQYHPKTFDEAEIECNIDGGGLLTAIHNEEENHVVNELGCDHQGDINIGLKCVGKYCKWDDGSPMTYYNFKDLLHDDGSTRCFGMGGIVPAWEERGCGKQEKDCWVCRVKAKIINCNPDETEYKGGCVSVHISPLNQKSAEISCPGEGHLVSIHSKNENDFYKQIALNAGATGTMYIGGQYSNGFFEWTDGSYYGASNWANSFPNTVFGTCVQMLLASEFGVQGQWTNIDCTTKQAYMCFRDGAVYAPPIGPPPPLANAVCPPVQNFTTDYNRTGYSLIYSPNYPYSIPGQQTCEYRIDADPANGEIIVNILFLAYNCQSGTSLSLYSGANSEEPFITFTSTPPSLTQRYTAYSKVMRIKFTTNGTSAPIGTGWEGFLFGN